MKKKLFLIGLIIILLVISFWWVDHLRKQSQIPVVSSPTGVSSQSLLTFSVIGDPESDLVSLKKALEMSKTEGDEFTVLVGDLTHVGSEKEFSEVRKVLNESGLKYYAVPGNHDIYSAKKLTGNHSQYFSAIIGNPFSEVLFKNIRLLLIDNSDEEKGIDQKQMNFIKEKLAEKSAKMLFVFFHQPVYHPDSRYLMGYRSELVSKQKDELLDMLKIASPSAIFTGHLHHSSVWEKFNLKFYVAGAVTSERNWQTPRFLEVEIFDNGKFKVNEVEIN